MPSQPESEPELPRFDKVIGSATELRFPTGAFGKTCKLVAVFAIACAAIAWAAKSPWVSGLALLIVAGVTVFALRRLFDFADKNPSAAILEGAQFVRHEQIQLAAKGLPVIPESQMEPVDEPEDVPLKLGVDEPDRIDALPGGPVE